MPVSNTESLLSSALAKVKYRNQELTKRDVLTALHHYRGLIPKHDKFIFNDGVQRDLINIYGTIPVPYKGQSYNIPVSLWLLDTHPYHAPICYVKPTQDMQIKVSKHVDNSGKIYLPYLHDWSHPNSDLLGLIQICIVTFSEQPPVYSKPANVAYTTQPQQPQPNYSYPHPSPGYYQQFSPSANHFTASYNQYQQPQAHAADIDNKSFAAKDHEKMSILATAEEKVRRKLREEVSSRHAETESLKHVGEELSGGKNRLLQMISKLTQETDDLDKKITVMKEKEAELSVIRDKLVENGDVDCDEAVTATNPLYKQLINTYAEESATEDAIYFLGEALRRGVVDCEVFLKHVRNLSRKQFLCRATMQKCRKVAGLGI